MKTDTPKKPKRSLGTGRTLWVGGGPHLAQLLVNKRTQQHYFRIRARGNHRIIAESESYHHKADAIKTILLLKHSLAAVKEYPRA